MNFLSVLTLIFITLKLTNYIDWSWWLVSLPFLIAVGISLFYFLIAIYILAKKIK
jgi:hypothetical protein